MICVVQRVLEARVDVDGATVGAIGQGLLVLASVVHDDMESEIERMAKKLIGLRIFRNGDKHFDHDVTQIPGGAILLVSNFTVAADTRRGRRPSLEAAAPPDRGRELFDHLVAAVKRLGLRVATGQFGADMKVALTNCGPVTFLVRSRET